MSLIYIVIAIFMLFAVVVLFGAPYLPTLSNTKKTAIDLLAMKPGQTMLELGSGDGRVMVEAAKRGINVVGYELNPLLVLISLYTTRKYRKQIKVKWGNFFTAKWPKHDAIFVFLTDKFMPRLDSKIKADSKKPLLVASNSFKIPNKKPIKESYGVYLYKY
jgi:16S rRNA A1518/A1519 N6-dimethyltransferase RsmA/KsgA/DIM1 with predicted DNA glycosylase/AP lyase activity